MVVGDFAFTVQVKQTELPVASLEF